MKATLRSGTRGLVSVELKARPRGRKRPPESARDDPARPPLLWSGEEALPPPPRDHDTNGRNER